MSYPTLMFRCPGPHFAHDGQTYEYVAVQDEEQLHARLKEDWSVSLLEAVAHANCPNEDVDDQEEDHPATREELEVKAKELGIKFDGRTSDASLLKKIEEAV